MADFVEVLADLTKQSVFRVGLFKEWLNRDQRELWMYGV